jgi:hypothetical protein
MTASGRRRFLDYIEVLDRVVRDAVSAGGATKTDPVRSRLRHA